MSVSSITLRSIGFLSELSKIISKNFSFPSFSSCGISTSFVSRRTVVESVGIARCIN